MNIKHVLLIVLACSIVHAQGQGWISEEPQVEQVAEYQEQNPSFEKENTSGKKIDSKTKPQLQPEEPVNEDQQEQDIQEEQIPQSMDPFARRDNQNGNGKRSVSLQEEQRYMYKRGKDSSMFRNRDEKGRGKRPVRAPMQHYDPQQSENQFEISQQMIFLFGIIILGILGIACLRKSSRHTNGYLRRLNRRRMFHHISPQFVGPYPHPQMQTQPIQFHAQVQPAYNQIQNQIQYHKRELQRLSAHSRPQFSNQQSGRAMIHEYYNEE